MRIVTIALALVCTSVFATRAVALPPPLGADDDAAKNVDSSIIATMDGVDDIAFLLLWNGEEHVDRIGYCEWQASIGGGDPGSTTVRVHEKLNQGTNYLVFVLYNQIYKGFGQGKWSYHFKLKQDLRTVWEKKDFVRENDAEIKAWKVLKVDVGTSGTVSISADNKDIPKDEMKVLTKLMAELENTLVRKAPTKTGGISDVIGSVLSEY